MFNLNELIHLERGSDLSELFDTINQEQGFSFVECRYLKEEKKDSRSLIFINGRMVFVSSNYEVAGVRSEGEGVSAFIPLSFLDTEPHLKAAEKKFIQDLNYCDIYVVHCTAIPRLLRSLKQIDELRGENTNLNWFFNKYQHQLEMVIDDARS